MNKQKKVVFALFARFCDNYWLGIIQDLRNILGRQFSKAADVYLNIFVLYSLKNIITW